MVSMYSRPLVASLKIFLNNETCFATFPSSTKVSGQTFFINSSLSTKCPAFSTRKSRASKAFGGSGKGFPSRSRRHSSASRRKRPKPYKCLVFLFITPRKEFFRISSRFRKDCETATDVRFEMPADRRSQDDPKHILGASERSAQHAKHLFGADRSR